MVKSTLYLPDMSFAFIIIHLSKIIQGSLFGRLPIYELLCSRAASSRCSGSSSCSASRSSRSNSSGAIAVAVANMKVAEAIAVATS